MTLYVDVQQIKNSPIYQYQASTPTFILDPTSELHLSADKIGIVVQNVLTTDRNVDHRYTAEGHVGHQDYSRNKEIYVFQDINQVSVATKYGNIDQIKSKSEQKPNFLLNTPIAMLQQKQIAIQPEKAGRLCLLQDKSELKISLYILQDISQLKQHQRKQPYMTICIGNTQFLSMILQIDHQIASKKHEKVSFSNNMQNRNGVERMHQSVDGKQYSVWSMKLDSMQNSRMNTQQKAQKYLTYKCIISIIIKQRTKSSKLQISLKLQRQQIKEYAGQINKQLANFMKYSKVNRTQQKSSPNQPLQTSLFKYKVSRMENSLSTSHFINGHGHGHDGENSGVYHGLRLDFSGVRVGNQRGWYLASRKIKGKSQIKPVERKSSGWLCCGNGNQDVDQEGQISVDFDVFGSKVSDRGRKGLSLSRRNVQLFVGPCQTKNLFSFLDPGTINKQKFHYLQPNCI